VTTTLTKPGLAALFGPYTPIGHTSWGPVYSVSGGRRASQFEFAVGDDDGEDPDFDDDDDDDEDGDEDDGPAANDRDRDIPASMRGKSKKQRTQPDDQDDDGQGDEDDVTNGDGGYVPPSKEVWDNVENALKRANNEAARRRRVGNLMTKLGIPPGQEMEWFRERGIDPDTGDAIETPTRRTNGATANDDTDNADADGEPDDRQDDGQNQPRDADGRYTKADIERAAIRAEARTQGRYEAALIETAAEAQLRAEGWNGTNIATALRFIDAREVEVTFDDEGRMEILGITEQIDDMKAEFPTWFRKARQPAADTPPTRQARGARQVDGADRGRAATNAPKGWAEQMSDRMGGKRR
jgi:hypothetical protein